MLNESNDPASSPLTQFNFSINLWVLNNLFLFDNLKKKKSHQDKFEMLQKISSDKRKLMEDFANIIQERVEIEETYTKGLEKLSNLLNNFFDKG